MAMFRNVNLAPIDTSGFERAGAAYGQMLQNLGNTIADTIEKVDRRKQQKKNSEFLQTNYGYQKDHADALSKEQSLGAILQDYQALQQQQQQMDLAKREMKMREETADVTNALTTFRTAALGQDVAQEAAMFPTRQAILTAQAKDLEARTGLTSAQTDSVRQSTDAAEQRLAGQIEAQNLENQFTRARIENEEMKQSNADRLFNQQEATEDRLQAAQNFDQAIKAQQSVIQAKLADSEILTDKRRLELQKEQQDNTATMQTLNYFLDADRFDFNKKFTKKEFNQKKAQIKKQNRIAQKNLKIAQDRLDFLEQQYEDGEEGRELQEKLTNARIKLTEAQANGSLMGSGSLTEFERGVARLLSNGEITEERANQLRLQRLKTTAGIESPQETMDFLSKSTISGIPVPMVSQALDAAKDGREMYDEVPKIKKGDKGEYLEFVDAKEQKFQIPLDNTTRSFVAKYKKLEQEILQQGTSAQPAAGSQSNTIKTLKDFQNSFQNFNVFDSPTQKTPAPTAAPTPTEGVSPTGGVSPAVVPESPRGPELPFNYQNNLSGSYRDPLPEIKEDTVDRERTLERLGKKYNNPYTPPGTGENYGLEQFPVAVTEGLEIASPAYINAQLAYVYSLPDQDSEWVKDQKERLEKFLKAAETVERYRWGDR